MIRHRRWWVAGGVAAGAAALIASCGGGGDGTGPEPTPTVAQVVITSPGSPPTLRALGRTVQFAAEPRTQAGAVVPNKTPTWSSSNTGVASITGSGLATAVGDGSTTIRATVDGKFAELTLTVDRVAASISVAPASVTFGALGSTRQLSAAVLDSGGATIANLTVTWSGTGRGSATVGGTGLVTAVAVGSNDTAIATLGTLTGRAPITVTQVVAAVSVTSARDTLHTAGRTLSFSAAAADSNANAIPGASFTWSSSATGVATVDVAGVATAVNDGTSQIRATSAGVVGSKNLVVRRYATSLALNRTLDTLTAIGATLSYSATAPDSSGAAVTISWVSRSTAVATVSPATGAGTTATAVGNGTTRIVASGGTRSDSASLVVNAVTVSFSGDVQPIFTANCALAGCHVTPNPQENMNLAAGAAYTQIVNVNSAQQPTLRRVAPGDPNNSYLIRKLEGGPNITGGRMPDGAPALPAATIGIIRTWISQGAPNN